MCVCMCLLWIPYHYILSILNRLFITYSMNQIQIISLVIYKKYAWNRLFNG